MHYPGHRFKIRTINNINQQIPHEEPSTQPLAPRKYQSICQLSVYMEITATVRGFAFVIWPWKQNWIKPKWFPILCSHSLISLQNNLKLNEPVPLCKFTPSMKDLVADSVRGCLLFYVKILTGLLHELVRLILYNFDLIMLFAFVCFFSVSPLKKTNISWTTMLG